MTDRIKTKKIMVGNVQIGGNNKVVIQLLLIQKQKIFKRRRIIRINKNQRQIKSLVFI